MNSFCIEQTREETKLAVSLHQHAEIDSVRLARAKAFADPPPTLANGPIQMSLEVTTRPVMQSEGLLSIEVDFRLTGYRKLPKAKAKPLLGVDCTLEMTYKLRPGFAPSPEQVGAFKDGNAIFNSWPYFRQHLQQMVVGMGYPSLTLPFLRVITKHEKPTKSLKP